MDRRQKANQIYDSFETKNMPRHKFVKEYLELTDPVTLQQDLTRIIQNKHKIDRTVQGSL